MTKDELLETLTAIRWSVLLGFVTCEYALRDAKKVSDTVRGRMFGARLNEPGRQGYAITLDPLADFIDDDGTRATLQSNLNLFVKQALIRAAYEHVIDYCEEHGCFPLMRAEAWYMYARIVRNTVSHKTGALLHRWPPDAPATVTWRGRTLAQAEVGKDIDFGTDDAFHLFDDIQGFARTLP